MKIFIRKYRLTILLIIIGLLTGFLYWKTTGCKTGSCMIKSHWYTATLFGGLAGYLLGDIINDILRKGNK